MAKSHSCKICFKENLTKDEIGATRKLIDKDAKEFFCIDCLADYLGCTVNELLEKSKSLKKKAALSSSEEIPMKQFIYADNAATTKLNKEAFNAMIPWLTDEYGNASQPYAFARKPKKALAESRKIIAKCINALPEEIYFTSGGTESDNWAIKGSASSDPDKLATITSAIEHHALLNACASIERQGYPVTYLSPDSEGTVDPEQLSAAITDRTRLVSIMFSNNEIGTIEPIAELARIAHSHGAIFHTDAVQAIAHTPIDVKAMGIDMLSASAHKFNGPKGVGFLYIRRGVELRPLNDGGAQEFGMRAGTENVASIVGMAKALEISCSTLNENAEHVLKLEHALLERLKESGLDFVRNGARNHIPGNISVSFKDADGEAILHRLDLMGICVSTGSACDSVSTQISHVLKAIKLEDNYARGTIRISFGKENTFEEADIIAESLIRILKNERRNMDIDAKLRPLFLLQILKERTDEDNYLTTTQLCDILKREYGLDTHRTTLKSDIEVLQRAGYSIDERRSTQNQYRFIEREFEVAELKTIIDAVASSKFIAEGKSNELIKNSHPLLAATKREN